MIICMKDWTPLVFHWQSSIRYCGSLTLELIFIHRTSHPRIRYQFNALLSGLCISCLVVHLEQLPVLVPAVLPCVHTGFGLCALGVACGWRAHL